MEFLRRNWVDLLMALLIATVIAAVLFLLLSGGKLFARQANNAVSGTPAPVTTAVKPKPTSPETPATQTPSPTKPVAKPNVVSKPVAIAKPSNSSSKTKPTNQNLEGINVPEIPATNKTSNQPVSVKKPTTVSTKLQTTVSKTLKPAIVQPKKTSSSNKSVVSINKPRVTTTQTPTPQKPINTTKPTPSKPTPTNTNSPISRSAYLSNYRIVVGSYKTQPRAETFAAQVRAQGFPARAVLSQGLYLVIVGPYARPGSAESVFGRLKRSYPGAVLYRPNGSRSSGTPASNPKKPIEGSSSKPATLNSKLATQATTKTSMTIARPIPKLSTTSPNIQTAYLQVGSFRNAASASPLLLDLRKAGYVARLRVTNDGLTRVIIGPLTGTPLELARVDLRARGLQPFTIR